MTRWFLDVGAVRIQTYLSRVPSLRGRRAASALLVDATSRATVEGLLRGARLTDRAWVDAEAGEIDGVVSLELRDPDAAEEVANVIVDSLRERLPAIELEWSLHEGPDHVTAVAESMTGGPLARTIDGRRGVSLPALAEWPLAARCEITGADQVVGHWVDPDGLDRRVGLDAKTRLDHEGRRSGVEEQLREALELTKTRPADDFATLARLGPDHDRPPNHLATIAIDGNRLGAFFDALARGERTTDKSWLSLAVTGAARTALQRAAARCRELSSSDDGATLPVVPHLLGGDDVLVSVPAQLGFVFATTFLQAFGTSLDQAITANDGQPLRDEIGVPSASAGIVIAHASEPFADCVALAEDCLTAAKEAAPDGSAVLAWLDVTRHGHRRPTHQRPLSLDEIDRFSPMLEQLAALPKHRLEAVRAAATGDHRDIAAARLRRLDRRQALRTDVPGLPIEDPDLVGALADLARWWTA